MIANLVEIKTYLRKTITYATSGLLTVGVRYRIVENTTGDFSNVGATYNALQETFLASGTTPTAWGDAKLMIITDEDLIIESLIPIVTEHAISICGTEFINKDVYIKGEILTFATGNVQDTITIDEGFTELYLNRYKDVKIVDSDDNNMIFTVYSSTDTVITLDQIDSVYSEETACDIYRVDYPVGLKLPFSKMINYQLASYNNTQSGAVKSEKIGKLYSVTYDDNNGNSFYPQYMIEELQAASGFKNGGIYVII